MQQLKTLESPKMVAELKTPETEYPDILKAFPVGTAIVSKNDTRPDTHGEVTKHLTPGLIEITWENGNTGCFHWKLINEMRISKARKRRSNNDSDSTPLAINETPPELLTADDDDITQGGFYGEGEFTVHLPNGWPVRVAVGKWMSGGYSLGFFGAVSPTGFHSDIHVDVEHAELEAYATTKALDMFTQHVPRDAQGNLIFDKDICEVVKGKDKGFKGNINGCVFEGKLCFLPDLKVSVAPSSLRVVGQGETSIKVIGDRLTQWLFEEGAQVKEVSSGKTGTITGRASKAANYVCWDDGTTGVTSKGIAEEITAFGFTVPKEIGSTVPREIGSTVPREIAPATPVEIIPSDEERLDLLEESISQGLEAIEAGKQKVWQAVSEIQRHQLWRISSHDSFESYCKARWGWERSNAYEVAQAGEITTELIESGVPESALPTSVAQVRELRKVEPAKRVEVLQTAIATTNGNPTAKAIKAAAQSGAPDNGLIESDENYTSAELMAAVRRVLGRIDLDVASCELANQTVGATVYFTRQQDGLVQAWEVPGKAKITIWDNCPYSMPLVEQFSNRHCYEWQDGTIEASIAIRNNATETKWFQKLAKTCTVRLDLNAREQFYNPYKGYGGGNRQGQTLFYFGHEPERFYTEFEGRGLFYPAPPAVEITPLECTPSISPAEFNREMALPKFIGCHLCKYRVLTGSGDRYWCEQGEFDDTLPLKYNWKIENEGCKSYAEPTTQPSPSADTRPGIPAIQKAVWEWLNLHGIEADEASANTAADQISEFLQSQFLGEER